MKKIAQYSRVLFFVFFLIIYAVAYFVGIQNPLLRTVFAATLAFVISPRKKIVQTQNSQKTQVTWVFLKKPIIID